MKTKELKHFWRKDGRDFIADVGIVKKAVVISYCVPSLIETANGWYKISNRGEFCFPAHYYHIRFDDHFEAVEMAESFIFDFSQNFHKKI